MANNISMIQPGDSKPEYGETITSWSSECLFDVYLTFILLEDPFSWSDIEMDVRLFRLFQAL
jgi:hypothetical protein